MRRRLASVGIAALGLGLLGGCAGTDTEVKQTAAPGEPQHCKTQIEVEMRHNLTDDNMRYVANEIVYGADGELQPRVQSFHVIFGRYLLCIRVENGTSPADIAYIADVASRSGWVTSVRTE